MAHIFVVDDDEQLLRMIGLMLERGGHVATLLPNPLEALERIKEDQPDLAILDIMMPAMNGFDLCRALRTQDETMHMPIMILTARAQEIDRQTALEGGADDYLSKPVTSVELLARVDRLLVQRHTTRLLQVQSVVVAVYGLTGGAGRTTLAANLAAQLHTASRRDVCLVDFTSSGGQLAFHFRLQPRANWTSFLDNSSPSWPQIEERLTEHPSGIRLLAAPGMPVSPDQIEASRAESLLQSLREHMSFVIIDLPPYLSGAVHGALQAADVCLHVIRPDSVSLQTAVRTERTLRAMGIRPPQPATVLNHTVPTPPLSTPAVARALEAPIDYEIPFDPHQGQALTEGRPLGLAPADSPLPKVVQLMATALWQRAPAAAPTSQTE